MEKEYTVDEIVNALAVAFDTLIAEGNKKDFDFLAGLIDRMVAEARKQMAAKISMN